MFQHSLYHYIQFDDLITIVHRQILIKHGVYILHME